jgi:DNA primase small subunit
MLEQSKEEFFLKEKFKEYYLKHAISAPKSIEEREFGIGSFGKKIVLRHLSFVSEQNLNNYLQRNAPLFISYSVAYYKFPEKTPMQKKELIGADLIYEFDADDLTTDCKEKHDYWKCPKCLKEGFGHKVSCPFCGSPTQLDEWFCDECLEKAKKETMHLLDFLFSDFGFSEKEIKINFSGNAGYHIHVQSNAIKNLSKEARIQLIDYLSLNNFDFNSFFNFEKPKGLKKRILIQLIELINSIDVRELAIHANISIKKAKEFFSDKQAINEKLMQGILPNAFSQEKKNKDFWLNLLSFASNKVKLQIDRQTSTDIYKLIRLPDSLHGSTGFKAKTLTIEELKNFKPFNDSIVFNDLPIKVFIKNSPKINLRNESFGPFKEEEQELPAFAAIYLIGREKAVLKTEASKNV